MDNTSHFTLHASRPTLFLLSGIILVYLALSLYQINLPGLHYDEAFEVVPAMQLLRGQPVAAFRNSGWLINGQLFPWMTQDYIGAINTYLALPFIAMLGPTPAAVRVMSILVGLVTLGLTYLLAARLAGQRWPGLAAAALLAVDPTFIFWNRQGVFVTAITAAVGLAAVLCWQRRWQGGGKRWSAAGAFCLGLGLYAKLLFVWLIAALAGAVILLNWRYLSRRQRLAHLRQQFNGNGRAELGLISLMFLLGCWPLLIYNLQTGGTFLNISQNAATSYYGVNNLAFGPNLLERLHQFLALLSGSHLWYLGATISNPLPGLIFGAALLLTLFLAPVKRPSAGGSEQAQNGAAAKIALFPFVVIGLVIVASIGTVSALWITHFAVLMPWPAIALALSGWRLSQFTAYNFTALRPLGIRASGGFTFYVLRGFLIIAVVLLWTTNLSSVIRYHAALSVSGGLSAHSDAVYDLSDWLAGHAAGPVVAMDWGLAAPVTYLTGGRVTPTEVFGYVWQPDQDLTLRLQSLIIRPETLYLWRAPDEIIFDRSPQFKALYRPLHLEETIEAAFYERSGRPILGVTRLVPLGSAANPPK